MHSMPRASRVSLSLHGPFWRPQIQTSYFLKREEGLALSIDGRPSRLPAIPVGALSMSKETLQN